MPPPEPPSGGLREPWVRPGLALLVVLSVLGLFLYSGRPQTAAELRGRAWVAVAPDAFTPRVARARERVEAALDAAAAGDTAAAIARYAEAEQEALGALERATTQEQAATATTIWAGAALDRATLLLSSGAAPWYRGDDEQLLREAAELVERVRQLPLPPALRERAERMGARVERQLRPGPLEWLPPRR